MAAGPWVIHDKAKLYEGDGVIDYGADTFKMALYLSTSNVAATSVDPIASATNEVATAFGYTAGGVTVAATYTESAGTVTFDTADAVWNASGGDITARFAVIYDDTVAAPVAKPIIAHCLLDSTPADVTVTDGNPLTVQINALGVFTKT
jgi:hypothetical protein